jgi:hypothetical protein
MMSNIRGSILPRRHTPPWCGGKAEESFTFFDTCMYCWAVPWLRRFVSRSVHVWCVVNRVAPRQVFAQSFVFPLSLSFHICSVFTHTVLGQLEPTVAQRRSLEPAATVTMTLLTELIIGTDITLNIVLCTPGMIQNYWEAPGPKQSWSVWDIPWVVWRGSRKSLISEAGSEPKDGASNTDLLNSMQAYQPFIRDFGCQCVGTP